MAAARPRKRRIMPAEIRIDDLLTAAADLFLDKGIEATTVDDIAARAGVAKGTFYHYFDTKTEVILALRERFSRGFVDRVAAAVAAVPADDHRGRIVAWLNGAVATYLASFELHDVVFHDFTHSRRQSQEKDVVLAQLVSLLDDGQKAGAWRLAHSRTVALILFDGMHGVVDDAIAASRRDPGPIVADLSALFLRMLGD